jgi:hypothetical protein
MRLAWLAVAVAVAACGPHVGANGVSARDAIVYIHTNVGDATVWMDSRFVGPIERLHGGVAISPGKHRLEVRRGDYFSGYAELDVQPSERRTIELPLSPILP